jgi:hypothetical protein
MLGDTDRDDDVEDEASTRALSADTETDDKDGGSGVVLAECE